MVFSSKTMDINFKDEVGYLTFKGLKKYSYINHAFSTRIGGVSKNEFKSMNLSLCCGDSEECVTENYRLFCKALNFDMNKLVRGNQIHGTDIIKITEETLNEKGFKELIFDPCDGFVTNVPGVVLTSFHADCPAIFMIDTKNKAIGLAHAGWRGTVEKISQKLLNTLTYEYGSSESDIVCAIGPGIGKCCFECSKTILPEFEKLNIDNFYINSHENDEKIYIDILEVNRKLLIKSGLKEENIFVSDVCSSCNKDLLFSHRATKGHRGNNASFMSIVV